MREEKDGVPPWRQVNDDGHPPSGICCQRAVGKVCAFHDPRTYTDAGMYPADPALGPFFDSTGRLIQIGDRVRFRGQNYTIAAFEPGAGRLETARIYFTEPSHFPEAADEISVDLLTHETNSAHSA